jgi:O-antigen/teichoic acid export membrane protein
MLGSYLASSLLYLWGIRHTFWQPGASTAVGAARRFGLYVWLTNLATFGLATHVDVLLLAMLLADNTAVSFYNAAALLLLRLQTVLIGWSAVLMPAAAEVRSQAGTAGLARHFSRYLTINLVAVTPALIFTAAWARPITLVFLETDYAPAAFLLALLALFAVASSLVGAHVCYPVLYVLDKQRTILALRTFAGVLNVVLNLLLIPSLGAAGAIIATGSSNLFSHAVEFLLVVRLIRPRYPAAAAVKVTVAALMGVAPIVFLPAPTWPNLIVGGILFALIFGLVVWRLRLLSPEDWSLLLTAVPRLRSFLAWFAKRG